ncbi:MAG: hypothetical protein A2W00_00980 [Candidatus Eisenbacteria bacterium RBG_16_71_46]|nr:MAG: hypothetical protein A2W00_00980 [Candidatus Eisenbacteria bacterium RBG_16_71_46]OGF23767.1 MAG: hypothetical protein A2V63_09920 [Candidatus Eisenbacteria bacterium RBG_19FT_COMBO_70_11]
MNKQTLDQMWDNIRQRHGIALRAIESVPASKVTTGLIPPMRTPAQQVAHMYGLMKACAEGVVSGKLDFPAEELSDGGIKTHADMVKFAKDCWSAADAATAKVTDAQLAAMVKTPWGMDFPGFVIYGVLYDEFLHHRGQLYAFLRVAGVEPPVIWDFAHNAPEFRPKAPQQA